MRRWRTLRVVTLALALLLMAALIARLGPHTIAGELAGVGPGALWLVVVYSLGTSIGALPWYVLLPVEVRPSIGGAIASRFAASGVNTVVPLGFAGEPARLLWIAREDRAVGIAAIVIDRLAYIIASGTFLLAGALATVRLLPPRYAAIATVGGGVLFVGTAVAVWLLLRHRVGYRIERVIARMRRRTVTDRTLGGEVDTQIAGILRHRRRLVLAVVLSLLARCVLALEVYAAFAALDVWLPADAAVAFACVPVVLSFAGVFVPNQVGIQESSQALLASALGLSPPTAVAAVLLQRIRQVVTALIAVIALATVRGRGTRVAGRDPRRNPS